MRDRHFVGVVDFHEGENEDEKPRLCKHCQDFGVVSKLGPRQAKQNEEPGPDWDQFMQCATCGTIYGLYEVKSEQNVQPFAQTTDNPFDEQKGQIESAHKRRNTKEGKKAMLKKQRERLRPHHKDPEIDELLRIYGEDRVKIVHDSDP